MLDAAMRTRVVGLAIGATAGLGLLAFIIYREVKRRRRQRPMLDTRTHTRLCDAADGAALLQDTLDAQEAEAQQQALAAVEAVVQGLSPEQQIGIRNQLDQVLNCVSTLRSEVAELRGGLQDIAAQIIQDVKKGVEDSQKGRRRRHVIHRERADSTGSSSIYFTASQGVASTFEETSEGGYSTAYAESDYTDRDTDREEGEREAEQDSEEEDQSCATVLTLRQEDSQDEEEGPEEHEEKSLQVLMEAPSVELALLLAQSDILHTGDASLKAEGYRLLMDNKAEYGDSREFLWRMARAYCDMYDSAQTKQERRSYAQQGLEEAELALKKSDLNAECHKWCAMASALSSQHESMHGKMKSGHILKEHLDRALALKEDDPMCFFLLGRWCYQVATLDWLEKKAAAALYPCPPSATLRDALDNFLKAEELSPGFLKTVRLYIAKCHKELGNLNEAALWIKQAGNMPANSHDEENALLEAELGIKDE
ncbi:regulator of microtubule dynamics protein 3-like isoform X1 [Synchiropus splendidus]|uniref:regulator of microtubule dynamics protein 3-like isoform X1 n=1 Tax=Synchiropus splendidus TaxID=270530 RepID=UPI00237EA821|nr:regulator of microtubule dynamics protein 3-like isoform X1 [Synchiropus splendidus]